jgi:putative tricarboxylic transport membrane protein
MKTRLGGLRKDHIGGALVALLGIATIWGGQRYNVGSLSHMGPGFFPVALGCILLLCGGAIAVTAALPHDPKDDENLPPEWRGWFCIVASLVAFAVIGHYGGLVPATFAIVFISALGDRKNSLLNALILAAVILAMCLLVFVWGLQITFPLFVWGQS